MFIALQLLIGANLLVTVCSPATNSRLDLGVDSDLAAPGH